MASRARLFVRSLARSFSQHVSQEATRPISEVPGPRAYPLIGSAPALINGNALNGQMHEFMLKIQQKYGPIFKWELAGFTFIGLTDPTEIQHVLRHEGKTPERNEVVPLTMAMDDIDESRGVFLRENINFSVGETWQRLRSSVNKHMMRPRSVASHTDDFREVAVDMVGLLAKSRDTDGQVAKVQETLFKWSFESACTMLLERRLGLLGDEVSADNLDFQNTFQDMLKQTEKLFLIPPQVAKALHLPLWTTFTDKWKNLFRLTRMYIDEVLEDIAAKLERGETPEGLVASVLANGNLSNKELYAVMLDLMGAAIDTTSSTSCMAMDLLSRNLEIQEKLYQEIMSVAGEEQLVYDHIQDMPYLKAVVKETLRLFPVAPFIARVLKEDIVLKGYKIPSGTVLVVMTYPMGRDPSLFTDPLKFYPDRWLRDQKEREDIHPYASLPFGFGPRACVGRRVAELEIYLLLASVMRRFKLRATKTEPIKTESRVLLRHSEDPGIQFLDRA